MVHSHGIRGGVVNLAPMTLGSSSMVGGWGTSGLHGRLHAFVKRALLQQLVSPGAYVCDLFCGRGTDTANWAQAGIGNYIGIDLSASALEEAKEQWEKHCRPFPATFQELDPCTGNLEILQNAGLPVDVVTCFAHLQDCFASEDMVRLLLRNVASLLKPGGYFFGTTPDSSTIWYKYQKAVEEAMKVGSLRVNGTLPRVRSPLYTITFEDDRFQFFGSKYQLRFVDGLPAQMQQLVHFPSFIRLAEEVGLEYVEIQNLTEFYDDYRVPFASTLQSSCKNLLDQKGQPMVDSRGRLSMVATDVLSLYSTFIFKKSTRVARPASYFDFQLDTDHFQLDTDFQLTTEFQFDRDLEERTASLKSDLSRGMSIGYELTPETTTPRDSSPRIKRGGTFSLSSGEELLISSQDDLLFDTATPKEESELVYTVQDTASPTTGRVIIESLHHPQQVPDYTPNSDPFFPFEPVSLLSDTHDHHELHFQEIDDFLENIKSCDLEERDRSAGTPPNEDLQVGVVLQEQILEKQEQDEDLTMGLVLAGEECDEHLEDEILMPHEEKVSTMEEEVLPVAASSQRTALRKNRMKGKKKRTARFCHPTVSTPIDPEVTDRQITCSVNYQSEVEQEEMDPELENIISVPAPPPFLFYQRKKRTEMTGLDHVVAQEAGFSTNITGSLRELRPRRSSSVGDPKVAPAVTKGTRSSKSRAGSSSLVVNEEESGGFNSDGALAGGRGRVRAGKARSTTLKDEGQPAQISHDVVANGRRSTRSCSSIIQNTGDSNNKLPQAGTTSGSSTMITRMTRMRSSLRSSF